MNHLRGYMNPQFSQELIMSTEDLWSHISIAEPPKNKTPLQMKSSKSWEKNKSTDPSLQSKSAVTKEPAVEVVIEQKSTPKQPKVTKPSVTKPTSDKTSTTVLVVSKKPESQRTDLHRRSRSDASSNNVKSGKLIPSQVVIPRSTKKE